MTTKTKIAQISTLFITLLLTAFPVRADGLAAPVPASADFWVRDQPGRITHACGGKEPVVLCMQGRKVVMQVQSDRTNGFSYTARFFNLQKEVEKKQVLFVAGREATPEVLVNDQPWKSGLPSSVGFDGMLTLTYPEAGGVVVTRTVYPSMTKALVIEEWQVRNATDKQVVVTVAPARKVTPVGEDIAIVWNCPEVKAAEVKAGGVLSFFTCVQAGLAAAPDPAVNVAAERGARQALIEASWRGPGRLETPDPMLDHAFALQKLHVLESPIETIKGVITHNGSLTYSPGIWANDPPEYSSPLFPFLGDAELNKASMNMYRVWLDYSREHGDAIPGCFWQPTLQVGQWERGDDAMILYGLSKFLLFQGDRAGAEEMWPLIEMCAASVLKHTTAEGIVASESDEMEGRYPTGKANLSTSSLAYGGYRLAARLAQSLGKTDVANIYDTRAAALRKAIEAYFGGEVEGFKTYRYYTGNTTLRGWILLPLAMDITERQNATLDAMVSDKLWPNRMQGADILAESTRPTEWGRETYYALRVLFKAGRTEEAIDLTHRVVKAQIFGARGPYPDEDAIDMLCPGSLYPRVFTEGMFGIVPTGLDSFKCTPWLPKDWPRMALRDIRAFGQAWDLMVERVGDQQKVTVLSGGKTLMTGSGPAGKTYALTLAASETALSCGKPATAAATLTHLRCEYLAEPLGIDVAKPRLSWVMEERSQKAEVRGQRQTAYQVLVASTPELLSGNTGDLWDSGKVENDQSVHVEYAGKPLASRTLCHWKVRVWDKDGTPSVWSAPARWSMGLLQAADWGGAQWIGDDAPKNIPSPLLRKSFVINKAVKRALVYATAHGAYELYLNGKRVGDHILAPGWTDYRKHVLYQTFDVTSGLDASGENVLGGMLGDGWYNAALFTWPARPANGSDARKLLLKLSIEHVDGSTTTVVSDQSWTMWRDGPVRDSSIYHGETIDAGKSQDGWDKPGYDASAWMRPQVYTVNGATLAAQMNEPIRVVMERKPVAVTQPKPGVFIFDMGQNMAGWCRATLSGPAGTTVTLRHGEILNPDGTLYTANLRGACQQETFILDGSSHRVFEPHFTYHGFRYVEVTGIRDATDIGLVGRVFFSDSPMTGTFSCSNPLLDTIWNCALWSQRGNYMSVPTDCPQRAERMGWTDNASVYAQTAIFNMDVAAFYGKWVQDLRDSQSGEGGFKNFAPSFETETGAPGWADAGVLLPWRLYLNYADTRLLREHYPSMKKYVSLIHGANPNHLRLNMVNGSFSDWLDGSKGKVDGYPGGGSIPPEVFATAMYFDTVRSAAAIAAVIGETVDATTYSTLADDIRSAFNTAYVKTTGEIHGNSQAGYALALHFDLLPENLRPEAARRMNDLVVNTYGGRLSTGEHATPRLLVELSRRGFHETACALMESTRYPSVGYMISQGATTTWERWDSILDGRLADPNGNSLNHWMFGAVCEWMYRVVLGINPDPAAAGYRHVIIKPQPGGTLTWAKGSYRSIHGLIVSNWKRDGAQLIMEVTIPANTTATVHVPAKNAASVTESGKAVDAAEGVKFLLFENGAAVYAVGSGTYQFQSPLTKTAK